MLRHAGWWTVVVAMLMLLMQPASGARFESDADVSWELHPSGQARDVAHLGGVVYIGGDFVSVNDGQQGGSVVNQANLVAFDAATGAHIPGFAPVVNGVVHAVEVSGDGRLFVGGEFTTVNGSAREGLVELDPTTGALMNDLSGLTLGIVYDLTIDGDDLYAVGNLSRLGDLFVSGAGRYDLVSDTADPAWTPTLSNGSVRAVAADGAAGRVAVGGFFESVNGDATVSRLAMLNTSDGQLSPHFPRVLNDEVFDLVLTADKLYVAFGGPGGRGEVRDPISGDLLAGHLTDGDVQAVLVSGNRVYFGHHGELTNGQFRPWLFAIDRASDELDPMFAPDIDAMLGVGIWALHDSGDHLWVGGRIHSAAPTDGVGILRFPAIVEAPDTQPPTIPADLDAPFVGDTFVDLTWSGSLDDSGALYYRVVRDGSVVGTTSDPAFIDRTVTPGTTVTYHVEAVDAAGNAAPSSPMVVTTLPPLTPLDPFGLGATWAYYRDGAAPAGWELVGFDDAAWSTGAGELGLGDGDETTVIAHPDEGVTVYFRQEFDVPAGFDVAAARLDYLRDDGVLVRINGVEVVRDNLPAGPIDHHTRALVWETANEATVFATALDPSPFTDGTNVITVELHNASFGSDLSFDAGLSLSLVDDDIPPSDPTDLAVVGVSDTTVELDWTASTDDLAVIGYDVLRDGVVVAFAPTNAHVDGGLQADTSYTYEVRAVDAGGNRSALSNAVVATTDEEVVDLEPPTVPTDLAAPIVTDSSVSLTWTASTDDVGVVGYDVYRDGVVVATVAAPAAVDAGLADDTTYTYEVVAFDAAGRESDPSDPLTVTTDVAAPEPEEVVAFGSDWAYLDGGVYPGASWTLPSFDDASWAVGPAHLGAGDGDETTVVNNQPTVWFRGTFDVVDPAAVAGFTVEIVADDGAVVFVNGVEVIRDNVGAGPVDGSTPASGYRWGAAEDQARVFDVPVGVLAQGENQLAVAVVNGQGSSDLSFDLRAELLVGAGGQPDVTPPSIPADLAAGAVTESSLVLSWTASSDDTAVTGYDVRRDGVTIASVVGTQLLDSGLAASTSYDYEVRAYDAAGNQSAWSSVLSVTTDAEPPVESDLIDFGADWKYLDDGVYPGSAWTDAGFDDNAWNEGAAVLAAVDPGDTAIANQPTVWLRGTADVAAAADVVGLEVDVRADDGVVVFVNGVEVLRDNVGAGPVDGSTSASGYRWGSAETQVRTFVLPHGSLIDGENVIAVALVNGSGSGDMSFDLQLRQFVTP